MNRKWTDQHAIIERMELQPKYQSPTLRTAWWAWRGFLLLLLASGVIVLLVFAMVPK